MEMISCKHNWKFKTIFKHLNQIIALPSEITSMANISGVSGACAKLKEMTLEDNLQDHDEPECQNNRNSIDLDLSPSRNSDRGSQPLDNSSEFNFDNVIGHLEDMLIDEDFHRLQNGFLEKYWEEFEDSEENKHCYMFIFNEYTNEIENFIAKYLKERITDFDMEVFATELEQRKNNLEGEMFEVLLTLSDFTAFKEIFLDYRAMKEGHTVDLSKSLFVSSVPH